MSMNPSERWQTIAPASDDPGQPRQPADPKRRRQAVPVACLPCRSGKAKCDGARPRCTRCHINELTCHYDVAEGVSRAERMKMLKKDTLARKVEGLERIVDFLRSRTDNEATTVLAKLRLGDRVEDVAKSLPRITPTGPSHKPPSLPTQESADSSVSGASYESTGAFSEGDWPPFRSHSSTASQTSFLGRRPSMTYTPPGKGKHPAIVDGSEESPFLSPIFDREDYLLPANRSDNMGDYTGYDDKSIDPVLTGRAAPHEYGIRFPISPTDVPKVDITSARQGATRTHIDATHLRSRQSMVNTIRLHSNLNLRNLFGNMTLSSSIRTNHYPSDIQETQVKNLSLPTWAMMIVNTWPGPGSMKFAFQAILEEAAALIETGTPVELVIETHPNIAALFDPDEFARSGILSQWAAGMVHAVQRKGNEFTCFASMYLSWYLMRWMIYPSPETYNLMPEWLRPTPNQLFMSHINILDYIAWPAFRELAVQIPSMQERMSWLLEMSKTVRCDWWANSEETLVKHKDTGFWDLCPAAKQTMRDLSSWSVGPSFRGYVNNADSYVRIRTDDF